MEENIFELEKRLKEIEEITSFDPVPIGDVLKMKFPKNRFLVENLIPEKGITIISGQPGCGKSWVALHIMQCIASQKKVFDKFNAKKGSVLFVDGETDFSEINSRMKDMKFRSCKRIFISSECEVKIDQKAGIGKVVNFVKRKKINLVILDPLIALHNSDENASNGMQKVMDAVKQITRAGATVLIIHHHKKNDDSVNPSLRMRGSSAIHGAIDSHIEIKGEDNELEILQLTQGKARRSKAEKSFIVKTDRENGLNFRFVDYVQPQLHGMKEIKDIALTVLNPEAGKDLKTVCEEINKSIQVGFNKIRTALKELETVGEVRIERLGHNTFLYFKVSKKSAL